MSKEYHYIKKNNVETRYQLKQAGYNVCHCCKFEDARWLAVYPKGWEPDSLAMSVHGIGYGCESDCEGKCPNKCIMCGLNETDATIHIFTDAESYLEHTNAFRKFVDAYNDIDQSQLTEEELVQYRNMGNNMMLEVDEEFQKRIRKKYDPDYLQSKIEQATPMLKRGDLQEILYGDKD